MIENIFLDLSIQCKPISVKRIGRIGPRPRPIAVELNSLSQVRFILRAKPKMRNLQRWNNIWISEDLTHIQREKLSDLRTGLKLKRENDDHNLTIRFTNGSPQLVKKIPSGTAKND